VGVIYSTTRRRQCKTERIENAAKRKTGAKGEYTATDRGGTERCRFVKKWRKKGAVEVGARGNREKTLKGSPGASRKAGVTRKKGGSAHLSSANDSLSNTTGWGGDVRQRPGEDNTTQRQNSPI